VSEYGSTGIRHRAAVLEEARERAEVSVSALLSVFAMPNINEEQIRKLLVDEITRARYAGFADGWDAALDDAATVIEQGERYGKRP
jgi:hypothetical protein